MLIESDLEMSLFANLILMTNFSLGVLM